MSTESKESTSTATSTVFDFITGQFPNCCPFVRYGFQDATGAQSQELKLHSIHDPIPDSATTASGVYLLTANQRSRLNRLSDNPFAISGEGNIVKELQTECENDRRVLYPVYLESDARDDGVSFTTMTGWIQTVITNALNADPVTATYWYSGSRSIHAHIPMFVTQDTLPVLKDQLSQFCEAEAIGLDMAIYKNKQQFRLPGAAHYKSGGAFQKVRIEPEWQNNEIIRAAGGQVPQPETFADVLTETFAPKPADQDFLLTVTVDEKTIEIPLIEQEQYPENSSEQMDWLAYNAKEFSPYALAGDGTGRSVAVIEVKGSPFARKEVRTGRGDKPVWALVPAYFRGARGCAGGEFTKENEHAPFQLSKPDYEKWDYSEGDFVVIIGGKSGHSIIHELSFRQATVAGDALTGEDGARKAALDYLESEGYDIGKAGASSSRPRTEAARRRSPTTTESAPEESSAYRLQLCAEQEGIHSLTHTERRLVAFRLLKRGWEFAWDWFKAQYGENFKPDVTENQFQSILKAYPEDYPHVAAPEAGL